MPEPQVARGILNRFGSVDPTEGGRSDRENLMLDYHWTPTPADTVDVDFYATRYKLRLWSDFTFYGFTIIRSEYVKQKSLSFTLIYTCRCTNGFTISHSIRLAVWRSEY